MKLLSSSHRTLKPTRMGSIVLSLLLTLTILSGCSLDSLNPFGENTTNEEQTDRVLRIAVAEGYGDDEWLRMQFTELFEFANPNITVEIVPAVDMSSYNNNANQGTPQEIPDAMVELKKMIQGDNPPDLVLIDFNRLPTLINENLLSPLDPFIAKDGFDTTKIVPTIFEGIKSVAPDGKLYALAPLFNSSALYYNKKIFNEAGVPYPTDGMTWDEIFNLAQQVSSGEGDSRIYGFSFATYKGVDPFWEMGWYTQPLQLRQFDEQGEFMTVDTDQWEQVWSKVINLRKQNLIPGLIDYNAPQPENPGPYDYDNFISGRVAMAISGNYYVNEIMMANKAAATNENIQTMDWDVVTLPSHPEAPGVGGNIYLNGLMGINARAQNTEDAWKFIQFVNGPDWARMKSRSQGFMVSNIDYIKPKDGADYNIAAFYQMKPAPISDDSAIYRKYPNIYAVQSIGQLKFQEALEGKKEVRQALKQWQTEGDAMLKQMRENPDQFGELQPEPAPMVEEEPATTEETPAEG
jgi:multiple sugar transport system substrate-binding protein